MDFGHLSPIWWLRKGGRERTPEQASRGHRKEAGVTSLSLLSRTLISLSVATIGTSGAAQSPTPDVSCATYLQKLADASVALDRASGRFQIYNTIMPQGTKVGDINYAMPATQGWIMDQRNLADIERVHMTEEAKALGQPPARCGFERKVVTLPGISLGTAEGAYAAQMDYANVAAAKGGRAKSADGKMTDGAIAAAEARRLAKELYPPDAMAAKRAAFEAELARLRKGFADR